jgi:hypothetical protein
LLNAGTVSVLIGVEKTRKNEKTRKKARNTQRNTENDG